MADTAVVPGIVEETYPFSKLQGGANVLVFPDLTSANKHVLQVTVVDWRSGKDRADPDGNVEASTCAATWVRSGRNRGHCGDRGSRCTGNGSGSGCGVEGG